MAHLFARPLFAWCLIVAGATAVAQNEIEDVRVEVYYVSDGNDATDTDGGGLAEGSRTYRIFLDLAEGHSLRALYGDTNHVFHITSTTPFFNNSDRGAVFGHEIANAGLDDNTAALDSWLSFGAASNQRVGVEKTADTDGSIVGGANNDGGSAGVAGGLLVNADPAAGIPLTDQDGLLPFPEGAAIEPPSFLEQGDAAGDVFDDQTVASSFTSDDLRIGCSTPGMMGHTADNVLLIAQLTTTGDLTFELNLEIQRPNGTVGYFVANDSILLSGETANGLLSYPPTCGCTDPEFLEYDPSAGCDDGSCQTTIVFGCSDTLACNFDPGANFHVQQLCCYGIVDCNGLDPYLACGPDVGLAEYGVAGGFTLYPNPVVDRVFLQGGGDAHAYVRIHDALGRLRHERTVVLAKETATALDLSGLLPGVHTLTLEQGGRTFVRLFVKE